MPTNDRHAAVVYNPVKVDLPALEQLVAAAEQRYGWDASHWHPTASEDSGSAAAAAATGSGPGVILVAGGDGTIRAAAGAIHDSGIPMALIPSGTGNLLARNLHLPWNDVESSVETAFSGSDRDIDLAFADLEREDGERSTHAFAVMAGVGLDASMAADTDPTLKRRFGWLAYADPIARSVIGNEQLHVHFRVDGGRARSVRAHTVIVGNCGTLTANLLLLPDAVVDDGRLDVVLIRPRGAGGWMRVGSRLTLGGPLRSSRVGRRILNAVPAPRALHYVQARRFDVRFTTPQVIQLDGDSFGPVVGARLTVLHRGLTVKVPAATRALSD